MIFKFLLLFSFLISFNNILAFAYNEEDLIHFLKNSKCHQCDLSNYNFEGKYMDQSIITESNLIGANFNNVKMAKITS